MTKRNEDGYGASRIADDCMTVGRQIDQLLALALADLLDGDNDTRTAQQAINEARRQNFDIFAVQSRVARRDLAQAETLSEQAARARQRGILHHDQP